MQCPAYRRCGVPDQGTNARRRRPDPCSDPPRTSAAGGGAATGGSERRPGANVILGGAKLGASPPLTPRQRRQRASHGVLPLPAASSRAQRRADPDPSGLSSVVRRSRLFQISEWIPVRRWPCSLGRMTRFRRSPCSPGRNDVRRADRASQCKSPAPGTAAGLVRGSSAMPEQGAGFDFGRNAARPTARQTSLILRGYDRSRFDGRSDRHLRLPRLR